MEVLLFPGSDALEDPRLRLAALRFADVAQAIAQAQHILDSQKIRLDLKRFMEQPNVPGPEWYHHLAVATIPVQVALYQRYLETGGQPDAMLSCSLGDIARNVCLGVITLEDALRVSYKFMSAVTEVKGSALLKVSAPADLTLLETEALAVEGVELSVVHTPRHFLVGGSESALKNWVEQVARAKKFRVLPIYPYALHTSAMEPVRAAIERDVMNAEVRLDDVTPVYSALGNKWLESAMEFRLDILRNVVQTVKWRHSLQALHREFGASRFVSLGPSPTLVTMHEKNFGASLPITNFFEECVHGISTPVA